MLILKFFPRANQLNNPTTKNVINGKSRSYIISPHTNASIVSVNNASGVNKGESKKEISSSMKLGGLPSGGTPFCQSIKKEGIREK